MKFSFALLSFFLLLDIGFATQIPTDTNSEESIQSNKGHKHIKTKWITQRLDHHHHHHKNHQKKWDQRILVNDEFHIEGGPLFICIGGEWRINDWGITTGLWYDIARKYNGSLISTEHRFYGESLPTKEFTVENLQYLSMNQALADLAHVIDTLKSEKKYENSKVVLAGCSYSAIMTVRFRKMYPHHSVGGWASSAPLEPVLDFKEYLDVVGRVYLELGGKKCYDRIQNATNFFKDLFNTDRAHEIKNLLSICNNFNESSELDQWTLFFNISNLIKGPAQYTPDKIPALCKELLDLNNDDATAYAQWIQQNFTDKMCINASYQDALDDYKWLMLHPNGEPDLPWLYQMCNEVGNFHSLASDNQPFGSNYSVHYNVGLCKDVLGENYSIENVERNVAKHKKEIGGRNAAVENTYQTHGGLDPWHILGAGVADGATIIPNVSHCPDLGSISDKDSHELRESKRHLFRLVRKWLAN